MRHLVTLTDDERDELLRWADHVDVLVRFCAAHMPADRVPQYNAGSAAFWAICHRIAGNNEHAEKLAASIPTAPLTA
jgi:hypothetical protein